MGQTRISLENQSRDGAVERDGVATFKAFPFEYQIHGVAGSYAGATAQALTLSATNYIFLNDSGALTVNTTGFPAGSEYIPLGTMVCDGSDVTATAQKRIFINTVDPDAEEGHVQNETPTQVSSPNGLVFTTSNNFSTGNTDVFLNGIKQKLGSAYTETAANQITFAALTVIDTTYDEVTMNYWKA